MLSNTKKSFCLIFLILFSLLFIFVSLDIVQAADKSSVEDDDNNYQDLDMGKTSSDILPDLFTGTMNYSIPIEVVPGRMAMQPDLALKYRSNRGNGWVGVGWDLEITAIERNQRTGVLHNGVDYNSDDFVIRMAGTSLELINIGGNEYRFKIERGFNRIEKVVSGGVFYWQMTDKTGKKYLFGQTADSRQDDPSDSGTIFKWCLDHVEDTNGNYMTFTYEKNPNGAGSYVGQIYPKQIAYTGNTPTGILPTSYVKFYLEARTDVTDMYTTHFLVRTTHRLKTIQVVAPGYDHMRTYGLSYVPGPMTNRSLLSSVQQHNKDANVGQDGTISGGQALPPITLGYQSDTPNFTDAGNWQTNWCSGANVNIKRLNFDGDGKTDILCHNWDADTSIISLSNGVNAFTDLSPLVNTCGISEDRQLGFGDFNADGKDDIFCSLPKTGNVNMALSSGNGFVSNDPWTTNWMPKYYSTIADFNGDGNTDLATWDVPASTAGKFETILSNGVNWFTVGESTIQPTTWCSNSNTVLVTGDFNGDGKTDLLCHETETGNHYVALSDGHGGFTFDPNEGLWLNNWCAWLPGYSIHLYNYPGMGRVMIGDFNGDGISDPLCFYRDNGKIYVAPSNGHSGFTVGANNGLWFDNTLTNTYGVVSLGEFNGDGMTDIFVGPWEWTSGKVYVASSNGKDAFTLGANGGLWLDINNICSSSKVYAWPGDFNGDGKTDLLCMDAGAGGKNLRVALSGTSNRRNDLLSSVKNGIGSTNTITYEPSSTYANTQLPFVVPIVSSITTCDNYDNVSANCNGNTSTTKYEYSGGFYYIAERDFRGFNHVKVTGQAGPNGEQLISETWFHQGNGATEPTIVPILCKPNGDCPPPRLVQAAAVPVGYMKGNPYHTKVSDMTGRVYEETTISYATDADEIAPYFNPPLQIDKYIDSLQNIRTIYAYDHANGNLLREDQYGDLNDPTDTSAHTVVKNYPSSNTSTWILGLLTNETVYQGIGILGNIVASTTYCYDGIVDCTASTSQSPTKGNLTQIVRWLDGANDPKVQMAYDSFGNLTSTIDANGNPSTLTYDSTSTFPTVATNALGHETRTVYYGIDSITNNGLYGQVMSVTDPNGAVTKKEYDPFGRLAKVIGPDDTTAPLGTISYYYENFGTVGQQRVRAYSMTQGESPVPATCPYGSVLNSNGMCQVMPTCPPGATLNPTLGRCVSPPLCPLGVYNTAQNRCIDTVNNTSVAALCYTGGILNPASDRCESAIQCAGGAYDQTQNRCVTTTAPFCPLFGSLNGTSDKCEVLSNPGYYEDFYNCPAPYKTTMGGQTCAIYDQCMCTATPVCNGGTYNTSLNACVNSFPSVQASCPSGYNNSITMCKKPIVYTWAEKYFDGFGRTIKTVSEGPNSETVNTKTLYDKRGFIYYKSIPYFNGQTQFGTSFTYDSVGRIIKTTNPDYTTMKTCYNAGMTVSIDPDGHWKRETKNTQGKLVKVEEYKGTYSTCADDPGSPYATTRYQYDVLGNLRFVVNAKNNATEMHYDNLGRKDYMVDPDMGRWDYTYYPNGNLKTQKDAKNQTITFYYDALNRITLKDYPTGTDAVYHYDEAWSTYSKGRPTTMIDASGTLKYNYDILGSIVKATKTVDGTDYIIETKYDRLGRITNIQYPDLETVSYGYDAGGNLTLVAGSTVSYATYSHFNSLGQPGTLSNGNGVSTTYEYVASNNRLHSLLTSITTTALIKLTYDYTLSGMVKSITNGLDSNRTQIFTYDELNRLKQAQSNSYGTPYYDYDEIGNFRSKEGITYLTDGPRPHAVTSTSDGKTYTYDDNGNMTSDGTRTMTYDYDNMLNSIAVSGTPSTFVYDRNGARVKKIESSGTTVYIGKLYECKEGVCSKYIFAGGTRIAQKVGESISYYHQDNLGSSIVVTASGGIKIEEVHYYPFGGTQTDTGSSMSHKYTSQEFDDETGLYYYGARYYNPVLGRFTSPDTIVPNYSNPQSFNVYSYVLNNPLRYNDPTGHAEDGGDGEGGLGGSYGENPYFGPFQYETFIYAKYDYGSSGYSNVIGSPGMLFMNMISLRPTGLFRDFKDFCEERGYERLRQDHVGAAFIDWFAGNLVYDTFNPKSMPELALTLTPLKIAKIGPELEGVYTLYRGVDEAGITRYVGITMRDAAVRWGEHLDSIGTGKELLQYDVVSQGLSKIDARIGEQLMINEFGLQKNGGLLLNEINSISPKYWPTYGIY